jgi:MerR family transcriptional regulator, light-induced transcriptional regulator
VKRGTNDADNPALPISAVELETGLSKDVLRVWERRYGFPKPLRDANGDRIYPRDQVERLLLIKRVIDGGRRPGKVVTLPLDRLRHLLQTGGETDIAPAASELIRLLRRGEPADVASLLQRAIGTEGLRQFLLGTLSDFNEAVGAAWMRGEIAVFHEHLYTEHVQTLLRQAVASLPPPSTGPCVLLTTVPGEQHGLGLLMVQAILALGGADARSFGTQMPLTEIAAAAERHAADVVGLSFSSACPATTAQESLAVLRDLLSPAVEIWAGGAGVRGVRNAPSGVQMLSSLADVITRLEDWRDQGQRRSIDT